MINLSLRNNFRAQLIVPVAIALLFMAASAIVFTVVNQRKSSNALNEQVKSSFSDIETSIGADMQGLSTQLDSKLLNMQEEAAHLLADASSKALQETATSVQMSLQKLRQQSGDNMAQLMAISAVNSVITKDFAALNAYVRNAHQNPDIVFLFYQDADKQPLTRFLNRKNEKLQSYLTGGKPDIDKIIQAGESDKDVVVFKQNIYSEEVQIGSVTLAMDMTQARKQAGEMSAQFDNLVNKNSALVKSVLDKESKNINNDLQTVINAVRQGIAEKSVKTIGDITARSDSLSGRTTYLFTLGAIIGFILVLVILLLNARSVLRLLGGEPNAMVRLARQIADGNLVVDIDGGKGIAGSLQAALYEMSEKLRRLIGKVVDEGRSLQSTSTELALASENMTGGAEQSAFKANAVAASTEEMSANMETITAASEQAAQNVNILATAVEEMTAAVQEIADNTEKVSAMTRNAVNSARGSSEKVNQLGEAAREISKVTEVITEISEQTNLLALNATIEAARAGEAGKGFAVVANEIKELAKQTANATGEIKAKIESIQSSTDETVVEITEITKVINNVNELVATVATAVEEQSVTAAEISRNVNAAAGGISEVNDNVSQATIVAREIARDIADVSQVSKETKEGSLLLQESSRELKEIAESISRETSQFNLGDTESKPSALRSISAARPLMRWSDGLSVGIPSIDQQHRKLVDMINALHQQMSSGSAREAVGKTLDSLLDYTANHFQYEEKLFAKHGYPQEADHKQIHGNMVKKVTEFQQQFTTGKKDISVELMEFLKDWLLNHIKKTDMQYGSFLRGKGVV